MGTDRHGPVYHHVNMSPGIPLDIWTTQLRGEMEGDVTGWELESAPKGSNWHGNTQVLGGTKHGEQRREALRVRA